jgi:ABC-type amino acid transport substrate-binding protein
MPLDRPAKRNGSPRGFFRPLRCAVVLIAFVLTASTATADSVHVSRVLKVLVLKDSPSMSYRDGQGRLAGFNVDLARMLCERMKTECEIEETTLATVIDQLSAGYADFSTAALMPTTERLKKVRFTDHVTHSRSFWFSNKPSADSGKHRVAVVAGSNQHRWVESIGPARGWAVVPVGTNADVGKALLEGRADAAVLPFTTTLSLVHEGKLGAAGFSVLEPIEEGALPDQYTAISVDPAKPELLSALNRALQQIKSHGELDELNSRHFPMRML